MPNPTLLDVIQRRFAVAVDPDSEGGQILNSLKPRLPFDEQSLAGQADVSPLSFTLTSAGVSVRAAQRTDALVFSLPVGTLDFTLVPPDAAHPAPRVELKLLPFVVPLPFLRPAILAPDGTVRATDGKVELHFPDLLLVITASAEPPATARLSPSHTAAGAQEVTMTPPFALIGPGTVVTLGFERAVLDLDGPGEPEIRVPNIEIYIAPPGIPMLAMHGGGHDLRLGLGVGGLSGDFRLALSSAHAAARPRFLHNLAARLRLHQSSITLLELTGQIDVPGEVSARVGPLGDPPGRVDYTLGLRLDGGWQASLALSMSGGRNYLWRTQRTAPGADDLPRNTLGAYAVFTPLLMPNLPGAGSSGYVDLAVSAAMAATLAASGSLRTQSVTWYGGELLIRQPEGAAPEAFLFFDLETELDLEVKLGNVPLLSTRRPLKVRHKAIGLRLEFGADGDAPQLKPVFDPARGFTLDLSDPGMLTVPPPLGDIVQPEGARMARENPLYLEVDLVLKADLGVVSVERASVRVPLDPPGDPSLTALGAHVDVPGALSGSGYLKLAPNGGFAGSLDVSVAPPLGLRAAAGVGIEPVHDDTTNEDLQAVLLKLIVELPVPIPLAATGLGLFGFMGLFAMHFQRNQPPPETALDWFVNRAQGDATRLEAWRAAAHQWAFGLGAVIGTVEGGFLIHAKGMIVVELPGPRLLLLMNADILSPRPGTHGRDTGAFLAVIEIRPESFLIGVVLDYTIKPLLQLHVPVEAYFNFKDVSDWHLDIGGIPPEKRVALKFLSAFRADGYLLIHGNGIKEFRPELHGFSVAAGVSAALTWGPESIGLYLKIAASADFGIGFKPFLIVGKVSLSGELHLFIIGIEVSASATLIVGDGMFFVSAEVCASISFFFFSISACITLELGNKPDRLPPADPMVRALSLHSRSPALLSGSGTDRPVDGSLGDAAHFNREGEWVGEPPIVPVDAIPVLQFEMRPAVDPPVKFFEEEVPSTLSPDTWVRRGERHYRYTFKSLALSATDAQGPLEAPLEDGNTPVVWWDRYTQPRGSDDNDVQLALLNWTPDATPAAAERTINLDERIKRRWGNICAEVAEPASVLWTFRQSSSGPSLVGWMLEGEQWPDRPGTVRSTPLDARLRVTEPWRSGNPLVDGLMGVRPAYVYDAVTVPERLLIAPRTGAELRPVVPDDERLAELLGVLRPAGLDALIDAVRLDTKGLRAVRVLLFLGFLDRPRLLKLRSLDAAGKSTGLERVIDPTSSRIVNLPADLPVAWTDATSPWRPAVEGVVSAWFDDLAEAMLLFETDLPEGTTQVEIGRTTGSDGGEPSWGLLIVEGRTEAELRRFSYEEKERERNIEIVNRWLSADPSGRALLRRNTTYTVTVGYEVEVTGSDAGGNPLENEKKKEAATQQFRFKTDDGPPARLEPWVLATDPKPREGFFFHEEPLRVVFATNATRRLYKAYGWDLVAVVKAASGNPPPVPPGFDRARTRLDDAEVPPKALGPVVMTPFESSFREAVSDQPCIVTRNERNEHERNTLRIKLEPQTDYILDLEAKNSLTIAPQPLANDPSYPMFRLHFTTSRYASMAALAADVAQTFVRHRRAADASAIAAIASQSSASLVLQVPDVELEQTLRALRWGDLSPPTGPHVTVIWQDGEAGGPQPLAVLLETPEPLWRLRDVPKEVTDTEGTRRYQLQPQPWLDVVEAPAGGSLVSRLVYSTSADRTLVILGPVARGGMLHLALRRAHHPLFEGSEAIETAVLATVSLAKAPWEDLS